VLQALQLGFIGSLSKDQSRRLLVVVQFGIAVMLMVGTLVINQQMDFVLDRNLGYDRENLIYFERAGTLREHHTPFLEALKSIPGVEKASATGFSIGQQNRTAGISWEGKPDDLQVQFWECKGDHQALDVLGFELIAGRMFSPQFQDQHSIIFNETAIRKMGIENPLGKTVQHYSGDKKIIGIVKDFTTESLHDPEEPAMFHLNPEQAHYIMARINGEDITATLSKIERLHQRFNPLIPFNPTFLDQDYQAQYASEMRTARLATVFTIIAILISCLGLFGLTIFNVARKTKEIGIRKVLGGSSVRLA
jgi:hypothetical protein